MVGLELQSHSLPVQYMVTPPSPHAQPDVALANVIEFTVELRLLVMVPLPPPNLKLVIVLQPLAFIMSTTPVLPLPPAAIAKLALATAIVYNGCTVLLVIVVHCAPSQWRMVPLSPTAQASIELCISETARRVFVDTPVDPYHVPPYQFRAIPFDPTIHPFMPSLLTVTP